MHVYCLVDEFDVVVHVYYYMLFTKRKHAIQNHPYNIYIYKVDVH